MASDVWTWRDGPIEPGPCVLVDLDGTLADARHRLHLLDRRPKDWAAFNGGAGKDPLITATYRWLESLGDHLSIVILTGRPTTVAELTVAWLAQHSVRWDLLAMRPANDHAPMPPTSSGVCSTRIRQLGFDPQLAIDDEPAVVASYERAGVPCLQITSHR